LLGRPILVPVLDYSGAATQRGGDTIRQSAVAVVIGDEVEAVDRQGKSLKLNIEAATDPTDPTDQTDLSDPRRPKTKTAAPEISGAAVPKVPFRRFPTPA
jgi:hypothetical protein